LHEPSALVAVEHNSDLHLWLELMAFEGTAKAGEYGLKDAELEGVHAQLNHNHHLHDVSALLEVDLVCDSKVDDGLSGNLRALQIGFIDGLIDGEAQSAEVALGRATSAVELEVGVDVGLAAAATQGSTHCCHVHPVAGKGTYPDCERQAVLAGLDMKRHRGGSEEAGVDLGVPGDVEAFGRGEGLLTLPIVLFGVGVEGVGGGKYRPIVGCVGTCTVHDIAG
jgi:hypothetical protein